MSCQRLENMHFIVMKDAKHENGAGHDGHPNNALNSILVVVIPCQNELNLFSKK